MGINGSSAQNAHHWRVNKGDDSNRCAPDDLIIEENLEKVASRFRRVQIECDDYQAIIQRYDNEHALFYFDPPYVKRKRIRQEGYRLDWNDSDHIDAAKILRGCQGYVVISGYACPLYVDLYENHGWRRSDKETNVNRGAKRIESLWLSPQTTEALQKSHQLSFLDY